MIRTQRFHEPRNRQSIRLHGYDYSQPGQYYITICSQQRKCIFGEIVDEEIRLSLPGQVELAHWMAIARHSDFVRLDEFTIMPNHLHGTLMFEQKGELLGAADVGANNPPHNVVTRCGNGADEPRRAGVGANNPPHSLTQEVQHCAADYSPLHPRLLSQSTEFVASRPKGTQAGSLGAIIQNFKKTSSRTVHRIAPELEGHVWQRNYYEHIIRDEFELDRIRDYVRLNPAKWADDPNNPSIIEITRKTGEIN